MKTITITYMQRVRITLLLKDHTGSRRDHATRTVLDLEDRIGIPADELQQVVKPLDDGRVLLADEEINRRPPADFALSRAEAELLLVKVDALQLRTHDLRTWADDLARSLSAVAG